MKKVIAIFLISIAVICFIFQTNLWLGTVYHIIKIPILIVCGVFCVAKRTRLKTTRGKLALGIFLAYCASLGVQIIRSYHSSSPKESKSLTMVSYNLFFKNNYKTQAIQFLNEQNADILCLQEVTPEWQSKLDKGLKGFPYKLALPRRGTHGFSIYSKFPIQSKKVIKNSARLPVVQLAEARVNQKKLMIYNCHLASPAIAVENPDRFLELWKTTYEKRKLQLEQLTLLAMENDTHCHAQIIAGDLNTLWFEPIFKDLETSWENSEGGFSQLSSFTFPNKLGFSSFIKLDYILSRGQIKASSFHVLDGGSADHKAISVEISI